jgi:hypothetical protein
MMLLGTVTVKVKRMKTSSGNTRRFVATATGDASIQPIGNEPSELVAGRFGTVYVAYVEVDLPVQKGDQITDPEGTVYVVKEVAKRDNIPLAHQELTLTRE